MDTYKKHDLLVVAYEDKILQALVEQLKEVGLGNYCNIDHATIPTLELDSEIRRPTLLLITSHLVYKMAKPYIDEKTPTIIGKRMINFANTKELLKLPRETKVYLVNNLKEAAEETIDFLQEAGIQFDYHSYYLQEEVNKDIHVAITPGEEQLVPKHIKKVINIGHRLFDMSTLVELFNFFKISTYSSENHLTAKFMQSIVSLTKTLSNEILHSQVLQKSLEGIVDRVEEGIIVYDQDQYITTVNSKAIQWLSMKKKDLIANSLANIPQSFHEAISHLEMEKEQFVSIDQTDFYMRKRRIMFDSKVYATFVAFQKIDKIHKIESNYQKIAKQKLLVARHTFDDIKTNNMEMKKLKETASKLAISNSTILILGETGTGKEVFAQAIHSASKRKDYPFVAVNLAAISDSLIESELFGYESGSFTGAKNAGQIGLFEQANRGTIFLDEIGDASPLIQNRLLRILQEREIRRVGGEQNIPVDVRVIAATNKDLPTLIAEDKFREDLFYRLNILPIKIPPLNKRKEDIPLIIELFSKEFEEKLQRSPLIYSESARQELINYEWPGNIRELRNTIEYVSHVANEVVYKDDLPIFQQQECMSVKSRYMGEKYKEIETELIKRGFLEESRLILANISRAHKRAAGRLALQKELQSKNFQLSEQQLRYRLKLLSDYELVSAGKGRQGSQLTKTGYDFLQFLNKGNHKETAQTF